LLIGCRDSMFEVGAVATGQFFVSAALMHHP
jgi:hypothetical protein